MANPKSMTVFMAEDRIGIIGDGDQIKAAEKLLATDGIKVSRSEFP
jgi:hypothetical protein